ncbi:MAG: stabilization protein [Podoviridae sp. ctviO18]|nr:MAG: stabilization protein [Podoviridae sp. ctviO18]
MENKVFKNFKYGTIDTIEDYSIPHGAASRSLGWLTQGDHIELMRGRLLLGTENTGAGRVSGIHVGEKSDGTQVLFHSYARKLKYYDTVTEDHIELSSNFLPAAVLGADGLSEDISWASYTSLAGYQVWINSPNGDYAKIMTANPGDVYTQYLNTKNLKGHIKIGQNRTWLFDRGLSGSPSQKDRTAPYGSYIDTATYTTVTAEALGDVASGTLAFKAGGARRTCFAVSITHTGSGEVYTDDYKGVLTGSAGGTGTINYSTGAFTTNRSGAGTVDYQWEDSTNNGIADFTKSATRTAGQGFVFRQDDGGSPLLGIFSYKHIEYCIHRVKAWILELTATDTNATNLIFRHKVGIPNMGAAVATGDGIYYVDDVDETDPQIRLLTYDLTGSGEVVPVSISLNIDLSGYRFNKAKVFEYGDFILVACRLSTSTINNRVLVYNRIWKSWDVLPIFASCFAIYNGVCIVGDSGSNNVYEIFSGLDDDDSIIENSWEGALSNIQIEELKKTKRFIVEGEIGPDQIIEVSIDYDGSGYALLGTIEGDGSYVDKSQSVNVGALTMGRGEIGGGGGDGAIPAWHYKREFHLDSSSYERIKVKYEAIQIGWASVSGETYKDIRRKGNRMASKYRTTS